MSSRVAYVLLEWPRYSETFILNEMLALLPHGLPVHVFCLRGESGKPVGDGTPFDGLVEVIGDEAGDVALSTSEFAAVAEARPEEFEAVAADAWSRFCSRQEEAEARRRRKPLQILACAVRIADRCRVLGIQHLHCHYADLPAEVGAMAGRLSGIPYSFTGHAKDIFTMKPERLRRRIAGAAFAVTCSETGRRTLMEAGGPDAVGRVHRIYHGIHIGEWKIKRRPAASPVRIVSVGRLTPKKGFSTLVEALAMVRRRGHDAVVEIVGDGREREGLEELAARLGVGQWLKLPGRLDQKEIRARFETATVFVLPSMILETNNQDGVANALLEAMAAAVPVVVSDIPALTEVVEHEVSGLVFPSGDAVACADLLDRVITDSDLAARLGSAGHTRVEELDCSSAAIQLAELFKTHVD